MWALQALCLALGALPLLLRRQALAAGLGTIGLVALPWTAASQGLLASPA